MFPIFKVAIALASFGVVYAFLTIFAAIPGLEHRVALSLVMLVGVLAYSISRTRRLATAFLAGFLTVFIAIWVQIAFQDLYFTNNPQFADVDVPFGLTPVTYTILFSPFGGLIGSAIAGLTASVLHVFLKVAKRAD